MHMFCLLSAYRMPKNIEKRERNTFRFSIIRRKIQTIFKSKALKRALLAELYGGKDATLVAQMVDSVSPLVQPPVQVVAPLPPVGEDVSDEEEGEAAAAVPANPPPAVQAPPPVRPVVPAAPTVAPQPTTSSGDSAATAVVISDSEDSDSDKDNLLTIDIIYCLFFAIELSSVFIQHPSHVYYMNK